MKQKRHDAILELIELYEIETQEELAELLMKEGYNVTQATISRDIKALRLIKTVGSNGMYKYSKAGRKRNEEDSKGIIAQSAISVDCAQNIVIIKTHSGMAQGAAAIVDSMKLPEIMGTIAGDDTIMCVAKTEEEALRFTSKINSLIQ
ncbi:MAG: arginine repressor [Ruminococcaceae bacterium]|nr:arginine repressor [Oscillospiraceae bacterium]